MGKIIINLQMWGQKQDYPDNRIQKTPAQKKAQRSIKAAHETVEKDIQSGQQMISKSQTFQHQGSVLKVNQLEQEVNRKKQHIQREMRDLDREMKANEQMLQRAKRQISVVRFASHEANRQFEQKRKRQIAQKVIKWKIEREEIERHRGVQQQRQQRRKREREEKERREAVEKEEFLKLERRKQIEQRMKDMEIKKLEREKHLHQLPRSMSTHAVMPRYMVAERNFRQKEAEKEFELELLKQKNKTKAAIDPEKLKQHEREYIERIKARFSKKKVSDAHSDSKSKAKSEFNLHLNRKDEKVKEQLQKMRRRQKFQQKLAKIPLNVDQKKKIQREINIDKANNPYKYNFLAQKSLNDQQIYREFQDFEMKLDPRVIGNEYLQKIKQEPRVRHSKSTVMKRDEMPVSDRPAYKNYLQEVKVKRRAKGDEVSQLMRLYKQNPNLAKQALNQQSQKYQVQAMKKIRELGNAANYEESIGKQKQIDEMFFKSLESKIAAAQFS